MSLSKSYQVSCEGNLLMIRRNMADKVALDSTREERAAARSDCVYYSAREYSAKNARSRAKRDGWIRHLEVVFYSHGEHQKLPFDICPACAPKVIPDHLPKGWTVACQHCRQPLTWDAGPGVWRAPTPDGTATTDQCGKSYDNYHRPARPEL